MKDSVKKPDADEDKGRRTVKEHWSLLPGGALLIGEFVVAAIPGCDLRDHRFGLPAVLKRRGKRTSKELIEFAKRLTPEELPRSLLSLDQFPADPKKPEGAKRTRVETRLGFSGARKKGIKVWRPPQPRGAATFVILDDRRDEFRNRSDQWPAEVDGEAGPVFVHKLHRPFPGEGENRLWARLRNHAHAHKHVVVVTINDLRRMGRPISRGLSWERTALDLVWQLLNAESLKPLRDCQHLIVRFGIHGALHWASQSNEAEPYEAWLIYDPVSIEESAEQSHEGLMVGYGSAFVAALLSKLVDGFSCEAIQTGVKAGLAAGHILLKTGFVRRKRRLHYPKDKLFPHNPTTRGKEFACRKIPVRLCATESDPGYWRLLYDVADEIPDFNETLLSVVKDRSHDALKDAPTAVFGEFSTHDRREIEQLRALHSLMRDYINSSRVAGPLNVAVFGPPGSGKSFGVKVVANALKASLPPEKAARDWPGLYAPRPTEYLTFNLSQYKDPDELAAVFHRVRDIVLKGRIPLVFLDEFDTALDGVDLGWLRYFLSPMQDGEFLDRGLPHPIGQAIFVFGGGTCSSYAEFARPLTRPRTQEQQEFKNAKGPDFLSRLRATLDIPGLDLDQPFDAYGPVELFPCKPAIQLRRASLLWALLDVKKSRLPDDGQDFRLGDEVIQALLKLNTFRHGKRSLEALLDMSHLQEKDFSASSLPAPEHTNLHASAKELSQLLIEPDLFSEDETRAIAAAINAGLSERSKVKDEYQMGVDDIRRILRLGGCECRRESEPKDDSPVLDISVALSLCPEREHDRWVAEKRRDGYVYGMPEPQALGQRRHPWLVPWGSLPPDAQDVYSRAIFAIPDYIAEAGYVVTRPPWWIRSS